MRTTAKQRQALKDFAAVAPDDRGLGALLADLDEALALLAGVKRWVNERRVTLDIGPIDAFLGHTAMVLPAAPAQPLAVAPADDARVYPCVDCGKMRSKAEGGTTFTVCDECWIRPGQKPGCPPEPSGTTGGLRSPAVCTHPSFDESGRCHTCGDVVARAVPCEFGQTMAKIYQPPPPAPDPLLCAAWRWYRDTWLGENSPGSAPRWFRDARERYGAEALLKGCK